MSPNINPSQKGSDAWLQVRPSNSSSPLTNPRFIVIRLMQERVNNLQAREDLMKAKLVSVMKVRNLTF